MHLLNFLVNVAIYLKDETSVTTAKIWFLILKIFDYFFTFNLIVHEERKEKNEVNVFFLESS